MSKKIRFWTIIYARNTVTFWARNQWFNDEPIDIEVPNLRCYDVLKEVWPNSLYLHLSSDERRRRGLTIKASGGPRVRISVFLGDDYPCPIKVGRKPLGMIERLKT